MLRRWYEPLSLEYVRARKSNNPVLGFSNDYRWLSNFYICDQSLVIDGIKFDCSERSYMWFKSGDPKYRNRLMLATSPADCKRVGRSVKLRSDWEQIKIDVMYRVLHAKYKANPSLVQKLLATDHRYLEETNTWKDQFWGRCYGKGQNHLGRLHMCIRHQYRTNQL